MDLSSFEYDDGLARALEALLIIKGFDQLSIVEKIIARKGDRSQGLTAVENASMRKYSQGVIARLALDVSSLTQQDLDTATWRLACPEPFDADVYNDSLAFSTGSEVRISRPGKIDQVIRSDWMSFVHTVEFSADGSKVLITSAGFDTVLECDVQTGGVVWEWNAWDHGFNRSAAGPKFIARRRPQALALAERYGEDSVLYVDNPIQWPPEGIPTPLSPLRINGASYGSRGAVLVTCYHLPGVLLINRDGSFKAENLGLRHPHSFQRGQFQGRDRYWVADSGRGRVLIMDDRFRIIARLEFSALSADERKRKGFGEWIQTITVISDAGRELVLAIDALRVGVHVLDIASRRRRFIPYPVHWTVQTAIPLVGRYELMELSGYNAAL